MKHVDLNELEDAKIRAIASNEALPGDPDEQEQEKAPAPQPAPEPAPAPAPQVLYGRELILALRQWAILLVDHPRDIHLLHGLEYRSPSWLNALQCASVPETPFGIAAASGQFPGLNVQSSVGDVIRYFDLSAHNVHAFTCDCGGEIDRGDMAQRLLNIANHV